MKFIHVVTATGLSILFSSLAVHAADELRGAAAILGEVAAKTGAEAAAVAKPLSPAAVLRRDLSNFSAQVSTLAPSEAARAWLGLADRQGKVGSPVQFGAEGLDAPPVQFAEVIAALPPPDAWNELVKAIGSRPAPSGLKDLRELCLRLVASGLAGDRAGISAQVSAFDELLLKAKREEARALLYVSRSLNEALVALTDDPKGIVAGVERQLAAAERERGYGGESIYLPDIVGILGEETATPLLERALKSKARSFSVQGNATKKLARGLALKLIDELKAPRWELVDSIDAVELYEAFEKKFPVSKPVPGATPAEAIAEMEMGDFSNDYARKTAGTYYMMGLIVRGRAADAAKFARSFEEQDSQFGMHIVSGEGALARAGFTKELDNFLHELLSQDPDLPFWELYVSAAASAGTTDRMLARARTAAARPSLGGLKKGAIQEVLYRALLAADQVDEGVKELKSLLALAPKPGERPAGPSRRAYTSRQIDFKEHALVLARIGLLLDQTEWLNEGLAVTQAPDQDQNDFYSSYRTRGIVELLVRAGRPAEAEKLLAEELIREVKRASNPNSYGSSEGGSEALKLLASFYEHSGRHDDVLLLLEKSPYWGAKDLAQLLSRNDGGMDFDAGEFASGRFSKGSKGHPLGQAAAAALANAGRSDEALAVVDALLNLSGGSDRAYELLIKISGQNAMQKLDELFARDQFEERPLIWKAVLLHRAGKFEEAEKVARQAIAIDPSDGEQGKNDRMRVYAVLSDIRVARGDVKDAEFLRGVVRAIRLSERADDFYAAGLLSRAVKMYQNSLNSFADAYCIQSRLAVHLSELGQHELAAKHYEKAFELMPDSFGRVESHCFGCEGTFGAPQAQGVAERVFTKLAAKSPDKPQIHYLFGYLRQQQGRGREALPHFRQALKLDPDYLNAWEHLEQVGNEHRLPAADRDAIAFNILRLDPLGRHATASLDSVSDLRGLWTAVEAAVKQKVKLPSTLLTLTASRDELEKREREAKSSRDPFRHRHVYYSSEYGARRTEGPGAVLAQHRLFAGIASLAEAAGSLGME